ncbi:envelope glycoprotein H [Bovine alphaherpesvirus 5]|nr:envelope glycoprotein H [Bovine alphaherpesvirus 5]QVY10570.1 UL22 glycoprotein H [Bovine alphaherpesvirus 5]UHJ15462.1 UL22 glycoprotein H [Bovine alphaherpesvirus 5]UHJ15535.1 UL22 glycoprotein H [Bovine alphaherpesvirus 5]
MRRPLRAALLALAALALAALAAGAPAGGKRGERKGGDARYEVEEWEMVVGGESAVHTFAIHCLGPRGIERVAHVANLSRLLGEYIAVHVDFARTAGRRDTMFFLPRAAAANVSDAGIPDTPDVQSHPGLFGVAFSWSYLQTRHLVDYDLVPSRPLQDWYFPGARSVAPGVKARGDAAHLPRAPRPAPTPVGRAAAFDVNDVLAGGAEHFFVPARADRKRRERHVADFAAVWPVSYVPTGRATLSCERAAVRLEVGLGFLSVSTTSRDIPPLEFMVTPADADVRMITAFNGGGVFPPPGPAPGPRRRAYVIGYGSSRLDSHMYSTMREVASYADEPADFRAHLAAAHREAFLMLREAAAARRGPGPGPAPDAAYHAYRVAARLGLALSALTEDALAAGYVLAEELIDLDYHLKLLARVLLGAGLGCAAEGRVRARTIAQLAAPRELRPDAFIPEPAGAALESVVARGRKLRAVYAFSGPDAPPAARRLAHGVVSDLYDAFLRGELAWRPPARHALFFAVAASAFPADAQALELARDVARKCTAMCTAGHATAAALDLEEAYARAGAPGAAGADFELLDAFSPCMASFRLDLLEEAHVLDVLSAVPARAALDAWLEARPAAAAPNLSAAALGMLGRGALFGRAHAAALAPELFAAPCGGWGAGAAVAIVPVAPNASYVLTRAHPRRGLTYTLQGIDVANPLLVTFVRGASCVSASGAVEARRLPVPGPLDACAYCGSVFVRYLPSGAVMDIVLIADKRAEVEFARGANSSMPVFNPRLHSGRSRALLLFPNGTVVSVLAFAGHEAPSFSPAYVWASVAGALVAGATMFVITKMLCSSVPIARGYSAVPAF